MNKQASPKLGSFLELIGVVLLLIFSQEFVVPAPINTLFNISSYGILILLVIGRWKHLAYAATRDKSLLLLVVVAVISIFWSENVSYTADYAKGLIRTTLLGIFLGMRYTPKEQMRLLSWIFLLAIILSLFAGALMPAYGTHFINGVISWRGIYDHKQRLGRFMGFAASLLLMTLFDKHNNRWITLVGMVLSLVLLKLSNSTTGLIMLFFTLALLPIYKVAKQRNYRLFYLLLLLLFSGALVISFLMNIESIFINILGKNLEFNGRTPIWSLVIEKGLERPILGYGYYGFWGSEASDYVLNNTWLGDEKTGLENIIDTSSKKPVANISHNGFLDLFLNLGLVGLSLCLFNFFSLLHRITILLLTIRNIEYFWMLVFVGITLITNLSESMTFITPNNLFWITYVSIAVSSKIELSRLQKTTIKYNTLAI
ncbi:O-antigen ligase [Calothrix sp. PCC 7507]|uniref:O-antigen ligase family protein n=1 Tax=Calothrix sp. PCC 7507 TaxID=99598 RepID=UPI00029F3CE8|nr:O-antigen ligase family protein [Calothrix sp. PCC 7507]AFY32531.1 O-antigen polymerase [Calothrix sp. PCC 7507]